MIKQSGVEECDATGDAIKIFAGCKNIFLTTISGLCNFKETCSMKNIFLMALFLTVAISITNAQSIKVGVKAGLSIPNLRSTSTDPVSRGWASRLGPYFGLVAEYEVSEKFSIQTELNYASQGGKKSGLQGIAGKKYSSFFPVGTPIPKYFFAVFDNEAILNYLELPILAKVEFSLNEKFGLFLNGGPYFGYLVSAKNISSGSGNVYYDEELTQPVLPASVTFDANTDVREDIKNFNFGIQGGVGLTYVMNNESKLFITVGGNYGLKSIQKDEVNGKNNIGAATVTIGYMIKL